MQTVDRNLNIIWLVQSFESPYTATVRSEKLRSKHILSVVAVLVSLNPFQAAVAKFFMASWSLRPPSAMPSAKWQSCHSDSCEENIRKNRPGRLPLRSSSINKLIWLFEAAWSKAISNRWLSKANYRPDMVVVPRAMNTNGLFIERTAGLTHCYIYSP